MEHILKFLPIGRQISFGNLPGLKKNIRRLAKCSIKNYNRGMPFETIQKVFLELGIYVARIYTLQWLLRTSWKHKLLHRLGKAAKKKGLVFPLYRLLYTKLSPHMISFESLDYYLSLK